MRKLVYVIGMGPGNFEQMTFEARRALEQSDVIVGYTVYVDLLREHFPDKQFLTTPMRQEVERCRMAFEEAGQGKDRGHGLQRRCRCVWYVRTDPRITAGVSGV